MPEHYDFRAQRLFVANTLAKSRVIEVERKQANYLLNVLRMKAGDKILLFNGIDGEWLAEIEPQGKKSAKLVCQQQIRSQPPASQLLYAFCPLKQARLDYMVQKAVEMGAGILQPVISQHTQVTKINLERMRANAVEAAEQCGILSLPEICEPVKLERFIARWNVDRDLIFCDEGAQEENPINALKKLHPPKNEPGVLIGPEGGFSGKERELLNSQPFVVAISLGPRILRADTAGVAALAIVQAVSGDW